MIRVGPLQRHWEKTQITGEEYAAEQIHHTEEGNVNRFLHGIKKSSETFLFEMRGQIRDRTLFKGMNMSYLSFYLSQGASPVRYLINAC